MKSSNGTLIQAAEWLESAPFGATKVVKGAKLIHCVTDGDIEAQFAGGKQTRSFVAGDDFSLAGIDIKVISGTFDIN